MTRAGEVTTVGNIRELVSGRQDERLSIRREIVEWCLTMGFGDTDRPWAFGVSVNTVMMSYRRQGKTLGGSRMCGLADGYRQVEKMMSARSGKD